MPLYELECLQCNDIVGVIQLYCNYPIPVYCEYCGSECEKIEIRTIRCRPKPPNE